MTSRKRPIRDYSEFLSSGTMMWKEKPPGAEQIELNRMFETNMIDASKTPDQVRQSNSMFMAFPSKVFATHFTKTKAKYGGEVDGGNFFK